MLIAITLLLLAVAIIGWKLEDEAPYGSGWEFLCILAMVLGFLGTFVCGLGSFVAPVSSEEVSVTYVADITSREVIVYAKESNGKEHTFRSEKRIDFENFTKSLPGLVIKSYNSWGFEVGNYNFKVKEPLTLR